MSGLGSDEGMARLNTTDSVEKYASQVVSMCISTWI